jgi:hypothetical protein
MMKRVSLTQLLLAGERTGFGLQGGHVMPQPIDVGGCGGQGFVLTAQHVPQAFNREGQIHNPASLAGRVGHTQSKARFQYTIQPSLRSFGLAGRQSLNLGPGR